MSFEKNNYKVVKNAISKEIASFCYSYILNKHRVTQYLFQNNLISQHDTTFGEYNESMIPNTYCCYSDIAMETLLERVLPLMLKETNLDFVIKIVSPKIEIKRFFENENQEKIISEIVKLSEPNNEERSIFIFPEGMLTSIYLEDLKNYKYIFRENYSNNHILIIK